MPRFTNSLHGIVWAVRGNRLEISLPRGGKLLAPKKPGIRVGDEVAFIMDACDERVIDIMLKEVADESVKRGSDHIFDAALRDAPLNEEDDYGEYGEIDWEDGSVFWCPVF